MLPSALYFLGLHEPKMKGPWGYSDAHLEYVFSLLLKGPGHIGNNILCALFLLTNLFRTGGHDCALHFFYKQSRAALNTQTYISLKLHEVYIEFIIDSCSIHNEKKKRPEMSELASIRFIYFIQNELATDSVAKPTTPQRDFYEKEIRYR
jgi:hypothetical protein